MKSALKHCIIPGAQAQRKIVLAREQPMEIFSQSDAELSQAKEDAGAPGGGGGNVH